METKQVRRREPSLAVKLTWDNMYEVLTWLEELLPGKVEVWNNSSRPIQIAVGLKPRLITEGQWVVVRQEYNRGEKGTLWWEVLDDPDYQVRYEEV